MRRLLLLILIVLPHAVQAEVRQLDNGGLRQAIADGIPVIDIRREEEWRQTGVIEGSHLLTFFDREGNYDVDGWLAELRKIVGPGDPVILLCRTGNRTTAVSNFLDGEVGQKQVYNATHGITRWISDGHPVVAWPAGR